MLDAVIDLDAAPPDRERAAACPRCGYDQRGIVGSWLDTCPLAGTCTECGLDFSWSEVLRPELHEPRWCVEYAPRRRFWLPPVGATLLRAVWPWWFWRSLKMSDEIRTRRLAAFVAVLMLAVTAAFVVEQALVATKAHYQFRQEVARQLAGSWQQSRSQLQWTQQQLKTLEESHAQHGSQREALARPGPQWEAQRQQLQQRIAQLQAMTNTPPSFTIDLHEAVAEAVLRPWATASKGMVVTSQGRYPYPAPTMLHRALFEGASRWSRGWRRRCLVHTRYGLGAAAALLLLLPVSFLAVPVSRRKAKVRWGHIGRVTVYSLVLPALLACVVLLAIAAAALIDSGRTTTVNGAVMLLIWAPVPLVLVWWAAAIRNYLEMPHAWALTLVLSVMNLLLVLAVLWMVWPGLALEAYQLLVGAAVMR